ncbi:MAG TPA: type II CAAX endopeptidase family protein [Rhabdochlamydiaceae bacterium]|nr:type II CAAX endopeptidase family protein [Rhabdochlamydiaceae bacterium]
MTEKRKVWLFILVAFGWSWLFWIPVALIARGLSVPAGLESFLNSPFNPAAWGPLIAALLVIFLEEGKDGVKKLLKRGLDFRFGRAWYLVVFLLFPVLIGGALLLAVLTGEPTPELTALANPITIPIAFVYILLLGGPLQEEFGWRGYALERFQEKWNALVSSIVVGLVWGAWHLPLFFMPRQEFYYQRPIWGLMLSVTLTSFLFTWLYNNTRGSILAALLFHTMFNLSHYLFPTLGSDRGSQFLFLFLFVAVGVVLVIWGPKRMVRERHKV